MSYQRIFFGRENPLFWGVCFEGVDSSFPYQTVVLARFAELAASLYSLSSQEDSGEGLPAERWLANAFAVFVEEWMVGARGRQGKTIESFILENYSKEMGQVFLLLFLVMLWVRYLKI